MRAPILLLCLGLAACASATQRHDAASPPVAPASQPPAFTQPLDVAGGAYRLDPRHASITWRILHQGLAWYTARFSRFDAALDLDAAAPERSTLDVRIDAGSVDTGLLNADGERAFDRAIAEALGAAEHPEIGFRAVSIVRTGAEPGRIDGVLTMNGISQPLSLDARFNGARFDPLRGHTVLGVSARASLERSLWDVTRWRAFTSDTVEIVIEAEFVRS